MQKQEESAAGSTAETIQQQKETGPDCGIIVEENILDYSSTARLNTNTILVEEEDTKKPTESLQSIISHSHTEEEEDKRPRRRGGGQEQQFLSNQSRNLIHSIDSSVGSSATSTTSTSPNSDDFPEAAAPYSLSKHNNSTIINTINSNNNTAAAAAAGFVAVEQPEDSEMKMTSSQSSAEDEESEAYVLAFDYVSHYLATVLDFTWRQCPQLPEPRPQAAHTMRRLCAKFGHMSSKRQQRHETSEATASSSEHQQQQMVTDEWMADWVSQFPVDDPNTAYPHFMAVADGLFENGIGWGRIIALFWVTGDIAGEAAKRGRLAMIGKLADYLAAYTESHLDEWIQQNGGWDAFVTKFREDRGGPGSADGRPASPDEQVVNGWEQARKVLTNLGLIAGVAGAAALGTMYFSSRNNMT